MPYPDPSLDFVREPYGEDLELTDEGYEAASEVLRSGLLFLSDRVERQWVTRRFTRCRACGKSHGFVHLAGEALRGQIADARRELLRATTEFPGRTPPRSGARGEPRVPVPEVVEAYLQRPCRGMASGEYHVLSGDFWHHYGEFQEPARQRVGDVTPYCMPYVSGAGHCGHAVCHMALVLLSPRDTDITALRGSSPFPRLTAAGLAAVPLGLFDIARLGYGADDRSQCSGMALGGLTAKMMACALSHPKTGVRALYQPVLPHQRHCAGVVIRASLDAGLPAILLVDGERWIRHRFYEEPERADQFLGQVGSGDRVGHALLIVGYRRGGDPHDLELVVHCPASGPFRCAAWEDLAEFAIAFDRSGGHRRLHMILPVPPSL